VAWYPVPVDLAIGLMLATELEHPLLVPCVSQSRLRGLSSNESMLLAAVLAFLEGLWRATRSAHPMQVWRVERWLLGSPVDDRPISRVPGAGESGSAFR
jgi:hypothetical protein